jgi:hypothetical protein
MPPWLIRRSKFKFVIYGRPIMQKKNQINVEHEDQFIMGFELILFENFTF